MIAAGGYVLAVIVAVVGFVCWWSADTDLRDLKGHVADLKQWRADNFGPQPLAVVDPPTEPIAVDTEPMELDLAGGARKPVPYKRTPGRHAA